MNGIKYGIEIEMEFAPDNYLRFSNDFWEYVSDGSLRGNSGEYRNRKPENRGDCEKNVKLLYSFLKNMFKIKNSQRCGLHIHISDENIKLLKRPNGEFGIARSFYAAKLMEKYILREMVKMSKSKQQHIRAWAKEGLFRSEYNNFCKELKSSDVFSDRYNIVNTSSLRKHGSLEVRVYASTNNSENVLNAIDLTTRAYLFAIKTIKNKEDGFFDKYWINIRNRNRVITPLSEYRSINALDWREGWKDLVIWMEMILKEDATDYVKRHLNKVLTLPLDDRRNYKYDVYTNDKEIRDFYIKHGIKQ